MAKPIILIYLHGGGNFRHRVFISIAKLKCFFQLSIGFSKNTVLPWFFITLN